MLLTALGLAMDCTAIAAARGLVARRVRFGDAVVTGLWFGGFQAAMLLGGALLGAGVGRFIRSWDHWVAFGLLVAVGAHTLWEARAPHGTSEGPGLDAHAGADARGDADLRLPADLRADGAFRWSVLLPLAVATSIDAFAVGVTLPLVDAPILLTTAVVGVVAFLLSAVAVTLGRRAGAVLGRGLHVAGGLVLIGLGVKLLVDHLRG